MAYELQENKLKQEIAAETKKIELITSQKQTEIATQEVTRMEKELVSTVEKPAYYERLKIETLADADRFATIEVAKGEAEGMKYMGKAEAAATAAIGGAEAQAMELKAGAFKAYGDAAIVDMVIKSMPSVSLQSEHCEIGIAGWLTDVRHFIDRLRLKSRRHSRGQDQWCCSVGKKGALLARSVSS